MPGKQIKRTGTLAILWVLIALLAITAATWAWFSFAPYANVTPMSGTVGSGDGSLTISNSHDGPFDVFCELTPNNPGVLLQPISTADLSSFYAATAQDANGISVRYTSASGRVDGAALHGRVWLQSAETPHNVYFNRGGLNFGTDVQALAALRLGLRFHTAEGTSSYIFRLDEMGNTSGAAARLTVPTEGTVVAAVTEEGQAVFRADPARNLAPYCTQGVISEDDDEIQPGALALCRLQADEIAEVEYRVFLEGCDINCINDVQSRNMILQLAFAGTQE